MSAGNTAASTANTVQYMGCFGNCVAALNFASTESIMQVLHRSPGVISNMWIRITANSIAATPSVTIVSRLNGNTGNQSVAPGSTATGTFTDSTHIDTFAEGTKISIQSTPGAATNTYTPSINSFILSSNLYPSSVTRMSVCPSFSSAGRWTPGLVIFQTLSGDANADSYDGAAETVGEKCRQAIAGVFQNMCVNVQQNSITGAGTVNGRKNGANGNISTSITANTTGFFEDTTHTDSVAAGNDYDTQINVGAGGTSLAITGTALDFLSSTGDCQLEAASDSKTAVGLTSTNFFGLAGASPSAQGTELNLEGAAGAAFVFSNTTIFVVTNTISAASSLQLRAAAAQADTISASITASTPGVYTDNTHTFTSTSASLMDYRLLTGGTGTSLTYSWAAVWATITPAVIKIYPNFFTTKSPQQMITPRFFPNPSNLPPMFVA